MTCLVYWINNTLGIVIFITGNRRYYNEITIIIYKFNCYIWKACKRWCIRKIYIFVYILILRLIILNALMNNYYIYFKED